MPIDYDSGRKLVTVDRITEIRPIENADRIEAAKVRGWTVVVRRGEFSEGDWVIYCEVDTAVPLDDPRFSFLGHPKQVDGKEYHVLRTARLRGQYSQGLVLPLSLFPELAEGMAAADLYQEGRDVTALLHLGRYEPPLKASTSAPPAGNFPTAYAPKTDAERVQNLGRGWPWLEQYSWDVTEKIDGTSCTIVRDYEGDLIVCSRNWALYPDETSVYWQILAKYPWLADRLSPGEAVQCEIAGPGIQTNPLKLLRLQPFVFAYLCDRDYIPRTSWPVEFQSYAAPLHPGFTDPMLSWGSPEALVAAVEGLESLVTPGVMAEGVVFSTSNGVMVDELGGRHSFKVINNQTLVKKKVDSRSEVGVQ